MSSNSTQQKRPAMASTRNTTANGGDVRVKTMSGDTYIAPTQRADGSWRKPRRVKEGYIPQDEQPRFESRVQKEFKDQQRGGGGASPRIPVGYDPVEMAKTGGKKPQKQLMPAGAASSSSSSAGPKAVERTNVPATEEEQTRKQLLKLEKKLDEIDKLKQKIDSGELEKPEKTQLDKVARRPDIEREIAQLTEQLAAEKL